MIWTRRRKTRKEPIIIIIKRAGGCNRQKAKKRTKTDEKTRHRCCKRGEKWKKQFTFEREVCAFFPPRLRREGSKRNGGAQLVCHGERRRKRNWFLCRDLSSAVADGWETMECTGEQAAGVTGVSLSKREHNYVRKMDSLKFTPHFVFNRGIALFVRYFCL